MSDKRSVSNLSKSQNSLLAINSERSTSASSIAQSSISNKSYSTSFVSQSVDRSNNTSQVASNVASSVSSNDYLDHISNNSADVEGYFHQINSISLSMAKSSTGISSAFTKMNLLNEQTGFDGVTLSDNELVNGANQSVEVEMIQVNNQKIKALVSKNKISEMAFRVKSDYKNYLRAKKAMKMDVTGINTHMSNSGAVFNQGIDTLNSHNSLVTSYANQLSLDVSSANDEVSHASIAASYAKISQNSASDAYNQVSSLVNSFQQRIIDTASSNAKTVNSAASQTSKLFNNANSYSQQVSAIASRYSDNSAISHNNEAVKSNLHLINVKDDKLNHITSNVMADLKSLSSDNVESLGDNYHRIRTAASQVSKYQNKIHTAYLKVTKAASQASSVADQLYAERMAVYDGANAYKPVVKMPILDSKNNTETYLKYYKQGYQNASHGFYQYLNQVIADQKVASNDTNSAYQIGFKNAGHFIKGIDDARKHITKNNKLINVDNYNFGYNSYRKLFHNSQILNKHKEPSCSLKSSLLLTLGFLVGYNN